MQLLLSEHQQGSVTVYTDGLLVYESLNKDNVLDNMYVVYVEVKYADKDVPVNTADSDASLSQRWPHRAVSKNKPTPHLRALPFDNLGVRSLKNNY
jgi:hypothetical protein